jgi:hypothetical protein
VPATQPRTPPEATIAAPAGVEEGGAASNWLLIALLSGAVFLASVAGRRIFEYRTQAQMAGPGLLLARASTAPRAPLPPPPTRNGNSSAEATANKADLRKTFEIRLERGYFESAFYLASSGSGGDVSAVARSPAFRWTAVDDPPQAEAITRAHAWLVQRLEAGGWEEVGQGENWYARRYRRLGS